VWLLAAATAGASRTDSGRHTPRWAWYTVAMAASATASARCGCTDPADCVDRRTGRYLTAVYWLAAATEDGAGNGGESVRTGAVGDRLGVAPATVTEMFDRLAAGGLVAYEKHAGVELTDRGEAVGRELAWRQCVVRTFSASALGVEFGADDSYRFGYALPDHGVRELRALADHHPGDGCCGAGDDDDDDAPPTATDCRCDARAD